MTPSTSPKASDLANALRFLSLDAVEQAGNGHPGMPMGMADIAVALWHKQLKHNPADPAWPDRDRFVLSNGHGSMLLYSLLHLSGYDLPLAELKAFRQYGSKTPGHPEVGHTPGVETTTGPLGQGLANAVGMALAERLLAAQFNREGHEVIDHRTWAFAGDGCLMEGVSHEACSLAGTWGLGKLTVFYDDNGISIDGHVDGWFTDDTVARFGAYGWQVLKVDGHDAHALAVAIEQAKASTHRPTLIICRTQIGRGAPTKAGTHECHGAPLGAMEAAATRTALNWPHAPFDIPLPLRQAWDARERGIGAQAEWQRRFDAYALAHPALALELQRRWRGELPPELSARWSGLIESTAAASRDVATRKASQQVLDAIAPLMPELLGGSADLAPSNLTQWKGCQPVPAAAQAEVAGNYVHYGVREFGMAAIINGLCLHGGWRPYGGTFLMFSDYARNALRMAALMRLPVVHVFTHDSIGLGEDGPTHQPIEQLASLRLIPNFDCWRPCDAVETVVAWQSALGARDHPTALILSRQNLPACTRDAATMECIRRGGYVLMLEDAVAPDVVLLATGSEVSLAQGAARALAERGVAARVVSMPSLFQFERQDAAYRREVLPSGVPVVVVEAGRGDAWWRYAGDRGQVLGVQQFASSAPADRLFADAGLSVCDVTNAALSVLARWPSPVAALTRTLG